MAAPRRPTTGRWFALILGLAWALAAGPIARAPVAAAADPGTAPAPAPVATATTITASPNPAAEGTEVTLTATVRPNPGGGTIAWTDAANNGWTIGITPVDPVTGVATLAAELEAGFHGVVASFRGSPGFAPSASDPLLVGVFGPGEPTTTALAGSVAVTELGLPVELTATVNPIPEGFGLVAFFDGITALGTQVVDGETGTATITASRLAVGIHRIVAAYLGDDTNAGSQSAPIEIAITPDTSIHASGLDLSRSTFYPVKDGYADTVEIRGTVAQPVTVRAMIYSLTDGRLVRSLGFGQKVGAYRVPWDGTNAAGSLLPAGRYRIIQQLRDAWGNTLSHTGDVALSHKRLVWTTASQARTAASADERTTYASALILRSRFVGGLQVDAGTGDYTDLSEAWVDYAFRLPAAAVYKSLTCGVLGATDPGRGSAMVLFRNWTTRDWDVVKETKPGYAWTNAKVAGASYVSPTHRAVCSVDALGSDGAQIDLRTIKLTYTYGVLR
jgi:Bacterial Ig-like domain (group 3)